MAEELNSDYRETTPASDQSGIWTRGDRVEIQRPKQLGHAASFSLEDLYILFPVPVKLLQRFSLTHALQGIFPNGQMCF